MRGIVRVCVKGGTLFQCAEIYAARPTHPHNRYLTLESQMTPSTETVTRILDGDTFFTEGRKKPVRLANVYAPDKGTESGDKATRQLRGLIGGKRVKVIVLSRDIDGSAVARVKVGNKSINLAMNRKLEAGITTSTASFREQPQKILPG